MAYGCDFELSCANSGINKPESLAKCALCRFSPENQGRDMAHYWQPTKAARLVGLTKHYALEGEKRRAKIDKRISKLRAKRGRDQGKIKVSRQAAQAEKSTQNKIIKATRNSGRRNKDGDHVSAGVITLDTKMQGLRDNPVILMDELEKVRADASRAGKLIGGLVIRNRHNVGCVVFREEDYAVIAGRLISEQEQRRCEATEVGPEIPGNGKASVDMVQGS